MPVNISEMSKRLLNDNPIFILKTIYPNLKTKSVHRAPCTRSNTTKSKSGDFYNFFYLTLCKHGKIMP